MIRWLATLISQKTPHAIVVLTSLAVFLLTMLGYLSQL